MVNTLSDENGQRNSQITNTSSTFKEQISRFNTDKKGVDIDDVINAIKTAITGVIELEITTSVSEVASDFNEETPNEQEAIKPCNQIRTVINLVDGDIKNEVGSQFIGGGPYAELLEFHLSQVKDSREIIHKNIESLQKIYHIFIEMSKFRKNTQF